MRYFSDAKFKSFIEKSLDDPNLYGWDVLLGKVAK